MNQERGGGPEFPDEDIEQISKQREVESSALEADIASTLTIDELLNKAETLAERSNPLREDHTDAANAYIVEARRRLNIVAEEGERSRLQQKLDSVYSKYIESGNL